MTDAISDPSTAKTDTRTSVESKLGKTFRDGRLSAWTQGPLDWIVALTGRLDHVQFPDDRREIEKLLDAATDAVVLRRSFWAWRQRFSDWWNGTAIEAATTLLDEAAIRFVEHADDEGLSVAVDDAVGYAETLPADDPMRVRFEEALGGGTRRPPPPGARVAPPLVADNGRPDGPSEAA
jgi:hypothetical protein